MSALRQLSQVKVAVIGLGYVGLPLAVELSRRYPTLGFDISATRIDELNSGNDKTLEISSEELVEASQLAFTNRLGEIQDCNTFIITVPTPIDDHKSPDMSALRAASAAVGTIISPGDVVIYESTVYPGATEEVCVPILAESSGLHFNEEFFVGYSPERINPGDKEHRLSLITKVTAGSTPEAADFVDELYGSIITAGTHRAPSLKVAEAAKVIENTQRDLNIALVNELALIFARLGIDTHEVLDAAATKWNFLPFKPGLVGGHCIGVDPYYLTFKAQEIGYHPEVILAGRRINDDMGKHIVDRLIKLMTKHAINVVESNVLVMGLAFKENCPDIRNTRVIDVISALHEYNVNVDVHDPWVSQNDALDNYGIKLTEQMEPSKYDAVILAVAHDCFVEMGSSGIKQLTKSNHVLLDVKCALPKAEVTARL